MSWTFALGSNRDMTIIDGKFKRVNGSDEVIQRIRVAMLHDFGEYFINTESGIPWNEEILGAKGGGRLISNILRNAILKVPGVVQIVDFDVRLDGFSRSYFVTSNVIVQSGPGDADRDFVVVDGIQIPIGD